MNQTDYKKEKNMSTSQILESAVIRFSGDSGDGMQLTGTQFSNTSALMGNDISTFPDYPSEIRAPQGTIAGVSGFQVNIGATEIVTPGDDVDMLVAMNPAALKANLDALKVGGYIVLNIDAFNKINLEKAGYTNNPLETGELAKYQLVLAPISSQTQAALKEFDLDTKSKDKCRNFYALGLTYFLYSRSLDATITWIQDKFKKNPVVANANVAALKAGRNFAETSEVVLSTYTIPAAPIAPGTYRQINGNTATAWGLMRAAEASSLKLFLGSYPITPATDILHELAKYKELGVKTFQAEDEIAGICTAIGASCAGQLAVTTTSGPGMALKTEAMGLAVSYEIPLVIVNVQRGGPSTGLPTKTEQSDLNQAIFGRNGEAPIVVVAASRPSDCFHMAYEASRIALQHMTPVILLTDGYIANGAEPWKLPDLDKEYPTFSTCLIDPAKENPETTLWTQRNDKTLARKWIVPGMKGFEYQIGGLEKDIDKGGVSHNPLNHQKMSDLREKKLNLVAENIPLQKIDGADSGDLLVISWGGTYGAVQMGVRKAQAKGQKVSHMHMQYIHPMPKNVGEIISKFKNVLVPELNNGQLKAILEAKFHITASGLNKMQGLPFKISEIENAIAKTLKEGNLL
jgi:2-oxoglutarate ferredoxin oxidoreductase subunit alpha